MSHTPGIDSRLPRTIMSPVNKPKAHAKKSSKAYDFTVTGKKESIHLRGPKDNLSRNLEKAKNEGKSQSENWIG